MENTKGVPKRLVGKDSESLQDEVYRHMFRVEARLPAADLDLAMTLVRAWIAVESDPANSELRTWLRIVSPRCLEMIEALRRHDPCRREWVN